MKQYLIIFGVLILVVMEYGLGEFVGSNGTREPADVLILVVMEYGLGALASIIGDIRFTVS